ncbi:MAG: asparaginase [Acetobacteraceae bacterium]|nr:asparaginase [Acetobacteraceae bacterium]
MPQRPRIAVFSTGGTIASVSTDDSTAAPRLTAEDLLSAVPQLGEIGDLEGVGFRQLASSELTVADMIALAHEIGRTIATGAVVTQGTDTLEETAFALDLLWDGEAPVVLTGAMRNPALPGADGPANLLAAALVAASPLARGLGALVVFNDEVHLPLFVRKTHTTNPATFRSLLTGPIGWIVEGRPRIALRPAVRHHIGIASVPEMIPPVALVKATIGDDGRLLGAVGSLGYQGLVIEATGGGHVPHAMVEPLASLARSVPVVLASRTGAGELLRHTYGFPGSETDLLNRGLIHAGILDGPKARVLLTLLLIARVGPEVIAEAFSAIGVPGSRPAFRWS